MKKSKKLKESRKRGSKKAAFYVLYGFKLSSEEGSSSLDEGYWTTSGPVDSLKAAALFPDKNTLQIKGFGTPEQWLGFISTDSSLSYGFKWHLVKTCLTEADWRKQHPEQPARSEAAA